MPKHVTVLQNARLVDLEAASVTDNVWIRIEAGTIVGVGVGEAPADGAAVEELEGAFVLPGLWDVHVHPTGYLKFLPSETVAERTFRAVDELLEGLRAGITSVRSAGEADYIDCAARDFFARGNVVGPRVVPCGYAHITSGFAHGVMFTRVCDGPAAWQVAVREAVQHGAEFIKIMMSGGLRWPVPGVLEDDAELAAAFDAARRRDIPVLAHAVTPASVLAAVRLGARSVEHGYDLDDQAVEVMRSAGTVFVPTLAYSQLGAGVARDEDEAAEVSRLGASPVLEDAAARAGESFRKALAAGVAIACGSDVSSIADGTKLEVAQLVRFGMKPNEALAAATKTAAQLCGYGDVSGVIAVGFDGDVLAVARDPLSDVSAIRSVTGVWKRGVRVT